MIRFRDWIRAINSKQRNTCTFYEVQVFLI